MIWFSSARARVEQVEPAASSGPDFRFGAALVRLAGRADRLAMTVSSAVQRQRSGPTSGNALS